MRVNFERLRFKNLNSYGNNWTEIDLGHGDLVVVTGKNGHGKSTFLDAISLALFGKPFREVKKGGIVNSTNRKDCRVELEFTIGLTKWRVVRGLKPTVFEIWKDGEKLDQLAKSHDMQKFLEVVLGFGHTTFCQIVALGSAKYTQFMNLPAADRRRVMEEVFSLSVFAPMLDEVKAQVSAAKKMIDKVTADARVVGAELKGKIETLETVRKNSADALAEKQAEMERAAAEAEEIEADTSRAIAECESRYSGINDAIKKSEEVVQAGVRAVATITTRIQSVERELSDLRKPAPKCDFCGKEFPADGIETKIAEREAELEKLRGNLAGAQDLLSKKKAELEAVRAKKAEFDAAMQDIRSRAAKADVLRRRAAALKLEIESYDDSRAAKLEAEVEEIRQQFTVLDEARTHWVNELRRAQSAQDVLRDDGVKAKIVRTYMPLFNKIMNDVLRQMGFDVAFYLDEQFCETIKSRGRDEFEYNNFSEGEKQRLNTAILFALRELVKVKNSAATNVLIIDEIGGGSLDEDGVASLCRLISGLDDSVFVITHDQAWVAHADRRVRAEKRKGFSAWIEG